MSDQRGSQMSKNKLSMKNINPGKIYTQIDICRTKRVNKEYHHKKYWDFRKWRNSKNPTKTKKEKPKSLKSKWNSGFRIKKYEEVGFQKPKIRQRSL